MVVIQGSSVRIRRSPRLTKTPEDAQMARTKVVMQPTTRATRNQPATQTQTSVPVPTGGSDLARQDGQNANENEDEEMKENDPGDADNPSDERNDHGADDTQDAPPDEAATSGSGDGTAMAPVAALTAALQQMATTIARIDARLDQLSTTVANPAPSPAPADADTQTVGTTNPSTQQAPPPAAPRDPPPAATARQVAYQPRDGNDDEDDSDDDDDDGSSSSSDDDDESDDGHDGGGRRARRQPVTRPGDRDFHRNRRRAIRDLDLPTFLPTPQTSVTTWIARVDLALEGARLSGRGEWTDQELYYILGNKLQDSAARWWVQLDRKLRDRERTWTKLKSSLLRRYGERPDKAMAEWRVGQRRMMPGETCADFAAALRDLCGNNRIRERVLLAQVYRSLDRTTIVLVKQRPNPTTLEEAVDKATEISDPIDNVAQGMENIGQAFVTAPDTYVVPVNGTTGQMALIPGVGSTNMAEEEKLACFTNSRGVYNKYLGLWEAPKGRVWNGHMWAPVLRKLVRRAVAAQLDEELSARDEGRAERYVCTVRPAMAALRYVHKTDGEGGGVATVKDSTPTATATPARFEEVAASEEGGKAAKRHTACSSLRKAPQRRRWRA
ncbi:hypothetical protein PHYSODRAFT_559252 [Phytophthora sojae]|uniref:Retrotransposon gag domain-containing protein n=1 Tax=Phytophthora sojae (strain P6497) TaxID=1094619 RepID=G4ZDK0_PHYSP|nr:hypothetical protein PHYSODRAFT_559252 [Phytophthora sojae]EGZ18339.1 hypothetical protein PHYSODRAFT_559252 [Phytophthora sojae]|eukprot:XP_009527397.1 hypothetical protein PHYSODRAFT_559252 [Phytophthora sojae]